MTCERVTTPVLSISSFFANKKVTAPTKVMAQTKVIMAPTPTRISAETFKDPKTIVYLKESCVEPEKMSSIAVPVAVPGPTTVQIYNKMLPKNRVGSLRSYFREFLIEKGVSEDGSPASWTQPEATQYINDHVVKDGGVGWNGAKGGKKNKDGTPRVFGDGGRSIEAFRNEEYEGCFDLVGTGKAGPYILNIQKYMEYSGPTKCHGFSKEIIAEVKGRSGNKCELCGHKGRTEIDHFIPKEKGGESILSNANALCGRCNDRKCNIAPNDFMEKELTRQLSYYKNMGMEKEHIAEILRKFMV